MANPKVPESDKKTGDKFEPLIDRAAGGPDRKRGPKSEQADAGKKDDDEDDVELDDEDDEEE